MLPGGLPDTTARIVGARLQEKIGQSVVVENRPGGAGSVAVTAINAAPADGYTLMVTDGSTVTVNPALFKSLSYTAKDFARRGAARPRAAVPRRAFRRAGRIRSRSSSTT